MNSTETKNTSVEPSAIKAWAEDRMIYVKLTDGRIIGFPADRFRILKNASNEELKDVEIRLNGFALRWEKVEGIAVQVDRDIIRAVEKR